jgi:PAS domain-containing protein
MIEDELDLSEEDLVKKLARENARLKQRVFDLENELSRRTSTETREKTGISQVVKLLERKDHALAAYATELEDKSRELEAMVTELKKKNEELSLWVTTLRLYQEIFENDVTILLGLNKEGKLILFNKAAISLLGGGLPQLIMRDIEEINFEGLDREIPRLARDVIVSKNLRTRSTTRDKRRVTTTAIPLKSQTEFRGVLLRISLST